MSTGEDEFKATFNEKESDNLEGEFLKIYKEQIYCQEKTKEADEKNILDQYEKEFNRIFEKLE